MDNYPDNLAPEFDEGGGVATPFEEWWPSVSERFPRVPKQVAKDWLHRHWSHSPFGWLPSPAYYFELVSWPTEGLKRIRTGWSNFAAKPDEALAHGKFLVEEHHREWGFDLVQFMIDHGTFPVPPVAMDNNDGHLSFLRGAPRPYPEGYLLIEGHLRFNIATYLAAQGRLLSQVPFWLMKRNNSLQEF